jgi:16S rRNA G966 N2-methylase RsmD
VAAFLKKKRAESSALVFDLVFLDPPYDAAKEYAVALGLLGREAAKLLSGNAVVIAEHRKKEKLEDRYGVLARTRHLTQGDAALSFYAKAVSPRCPTLSEPVG